MFACKHNFCQTGEVLAECLLLLNDFFALALQLLQQFATGGKGIIKGIANADKCPQQEQSCKNAGKFDIPVAPGVLGAFVRRFVVSGCGSCRHLHFCTEFFSFLLQGCADSRLFRSIDHKVLLTGGALHFHADQRFLNLHFLTAVGTVGF